MTVEVEVDGDSELMMAVMEFCDAGDISDG